MPKTRTIKCAYCEGTGKDPWGIPSPLSNCQVCKGRGVVNIREPVIKCPYCDGSGAGLHGQRMTCLVCGGKGMVTIPEGKVMKCPECKGSGMGIGGYCLKCKGKGVIAAEKKVPKKKKKK